MAVDIVTNQKTIQEIIDSSSQKLVGQSVRKTGELGKDEFLKLLITQLKYQDPMKPAEDKEFIAQMAQFSSLEQMQNLNTSFSSTKAFTLLGKTVTANTTDAKTNINGSITGKVESVKVSQGQVYLGINGRDVLVEQVQNVTDS